MIDYWKMANEIWQRLPLTNRVKSLGLLDLPPLSSITTKHEVTQAGESRGLLKHITACAHHAVTRQA